LRFRWKIRLAEVYPPGVKVLRLLFFGIVLTCADFLLGQAGGRLLGNTTVTITPAKVTLFAGENQAFVATVVGLGEKSVNWAIEEENGGTITDRGLYTAPKIQGVYHVSATTKGKPQITAVAVVTVLTYCDPLSPAFRQ
jgi:hypothetical protein